MFLQQTRSIWSDNSCKFSQRTDDNMTFVRFEIVDFDIFQKVAHDY